MRHPVVVFDLDGTLLRGTTVSTLLAEWVGQGDAMARIERDYTARAITNREIADLTAAWMTGRTPEDAWAVVAAGPWIGGMPETFAALAAEDCRLLLASITWRFATETLAEHHGLDAACGTEMAVRDGLLAGTISRYFDEHDKLRFVEDYCTANGFSMAQVAAVGDSRSDIPLFGRVGLSVALNATPDARAAATHVLDTEDLRDVLALL